MFYGFSHQSAIYSSDRKAAEQHAWDRKVSLIDQAKEKYAQKNRPAGSGDGGEYIMGTRVLGHDRIEVVA